MKETPDQTINRVIDRLKDILEKGNLTEKRQLADLLSHDEVSVYCALAEVEDDMQQRFDLGWTAGDEGDAERMPDVLKFPASGAGKRKVAKH